jgi:hypothetical protein
MRPARLAGCLLTLLMGSSAWAADQRVACVAAAEQAQQLRSAHQLNRAREELLKCAQATCPGVVRTDCTQWLAEVDAALPSVVIKAYDTSGKDIIAVRVLVDGVKLADRLSGLALPIDPGIHAFRYESAGMVPLEERVVVGEGEQRRTLTVRLTPVSPAVRPDVAGALAPSAARPTETKPVLAYVLAGAGLVALGSFVYFGLTGRADASRLADGCGATKTCTEAQVDPVRTKLLVADVSLGFGLVSLGVATWLFFAHHPARSGDVAAAPTSAAQRRESPELGWRF